MRFNIRRFIPIITIAAIPFGGVFLAPQRVFADVASDTAQSTAASVIDTGNAARFARVFDKARRGEPITVGFLGGSITEGYASSDHAHRYADLVTDCWRQRFPKSTITEIDAGVGGTGSNYGCLRVQHDLLSKQPDFVLVEFAVNDDDTAHVAQTLEGVVRQVLAAPGSPACMLLFMSHAGQNAQDWHEKVGKHYGLPMVSYRDAVKTEIDAGRLKWEDIFHDDIHPNDRGHAMAARYVADMLDSLLKQAPASPIPVTPLPAPLFTDLYAHVDAKDADTLHPTKSDGWMYDPATKSWKANRVGSVVEFAVPGRGVDLMYYRVHKDMGRVKVTIDGGHEQTFDGWFNQTWGGYRQTDDVAADLPPGEHVFRIELIADKAPQSNGHEFRILGIAGLGVEAAAVAAPPAAVPYVWKDVPVGGGGYVSGIIPHPTAPGLMYCKTDIGGAYRRDSATTPWVPITDWIDQAHWNYSGMESLAVDPNDPDAVFIAGGTYTNTWGGLGAFLRSHDRGKTWAITPASFKMGGNEDGRGQGERLAVDPNDGRVLFFGSRKNGLWHSVDRGVTWSQVDGYPLPGDTKGFGTPFVIFNADSGKKGAPTPILIAGCDSPTVPLLRSADSGATWSAIPNAPTGLLPHHAAFGDVNTLYVTFSNGVGPNNVTNGAVYRCDLLTNTWTDISPIKPGGDDQFGYAGLSVAVHDRKTLLVSTLDRWAKTDDLFRSHDGGMTWSSLGKTADRDASAAPWVMFGESKVSIGHWISSVAIDPADANHLLYVTGWGMWETHDAGAADHAGRTHWTVAATGIDEGVMTDVISPPAGGHVLSILWDIDGFRHDDVDQSPPRGFFKPWAGRDSSIDFAEAVPNFVVRAFGGQILGKADDATKGGAYSLDGGTTWTLFPTKPAGAMDGAVAASADGKTIVWTPDSQATVVSHDRGRSWKPSTGLPSNLRVVADRVDGKKCYAYDPATGVTYVSGDAGLSFHAAATGLPTGDIYLRAAPGAAGRLWLATSSGLFHSTDAGATFSRIDGPEKAWRIGFGKSMSNSSAPAVYLAGRIQNQYGFYRSDDDGKTWLRINDDAHQFMEIAAISGDPRVAGRVYVASRSRGVIRGDAPPNP